MIDANAVATPMSSGSILSARHGDLLAEPFLYRSIVGALQYLTLTCPKISYYVNKVCQFMQSPTTTHWQLVKRILCYLKGRLIMVCYLQNQQTYIYMDILLPIGHQTLMTGNLLQDFAFILEITLSLGDLKSKPSFQDQVQRQSTVH